MPRSSPEKRLPPSFGRFRRYDHRGALPSSADPHHSFNPAHILGAVVIVFLGATFFSCLSMMLAGIMQTRDRMMGIGQAITMPLFFASNALYPVNLMPAWVRALSEVNPLSYQVSALRGLLIGTATDLWLDFAVLLLAALLAIWAAASLLGRLVR
ncbi:MAG TPA: ABC transporter permease [Bryobacteraceae bacterium]